MKSKLDFVLASMRGEKVDWIAYDTYGRGKIFCSPKDWTKAQACDLADLLFENSIVTVRIL